MEHKNNEQKTAQILYITIIMVLLIMALTVGLVTAANRRFAPDITSISTSYSEPPVTTKRTEKAPLVTSKPPQITTAPKPQTTAPNVTAELKPTIVTPMAPSLPEFMMPVAGNISESFSIDALVYSNTMEDYRTHNGIDINCGIGDAVMASADGVVTEVYEHPMMGNTIVISHAADSQTVYQNLADDILVSVGDEVNEGDVIGAVGESALIEIAEEPHLHFEMVIGLNRVNPVDYLSEATMTISYEE